MNEPEYCKCEVPWLPIGGWGCERCGNLVEHLIPPFMKKEEAPPTLGVSVEETVDTKDKPG